MRRRALARVDGRGYLASGSMRGLTKTFAMFGLASGLAIVPAIGSQGAGALGGGHVHVDSQLIDDSASLSSLRAADAVVQARVQELARS